MAEHGAVENDHYRRSLAIVGDEPSHSCATCGRAFPEVQFYVRRRETSHGDKRFWQSSCKDCTRTRRRITQNSTNAVGLTRSRQYYLKRRYGITPEQWDAIWEAQGRRCGSCKSPATDGKYWHVDHNHRTGKVRGILCHGCNTGLGNFRDDPARLQAAIHYLEANDG